MWQSTEIIEGKSPRVKAKVLHVGGQPLSKIGNTTEGGSHLNDFTS